MPENDAFFKYLLGLGYVFGESHTLTCSSCVWRKFPDGKVCRPGLPGEKAIEIGGRGAAVVRAGIQVGAQVSQRSPPP